MMETMESQIVQKPYDVLQSFPTSAAIQDKVIADMLHDLGNFFHKLYYWTDYVRSGEPNRGSDATAGEMLEASLRQLQDYLKVAFDYFAPVALRPTRMAADDVCTSFVGTLTGRLGGYAVEVSKADTLPIGEIELDPGRISQALEVVVRQLGCQVGDDSRFHVSATVTTEHGREGLEIRVVIERPAEEGAFFRTAESTVEWALAEKLFQLHGGILADLADSRRGCVMFLPTAG
jgi:hypothetical protein